MKGRWLNFHHRTKVILRNIWRHSKPETFLYFIDRASRYNSLLTTNLTHFFISLFITPLYMFRASQCSSSGDRIVLVHHLAWLVCVSDCLVCRSYRHTKQSLTQTNHTRWFINTIRSPDDERCDARNMYRGVINKDIKKCVKLIISKEPGYNCDKRMRSGNQWITGKLSR